MIPPIHSRTDVLFSALSLESSQTSSTSSIRECVGYSIQVVWKDGSATEGTLIIEGSNDYYDEAVPVFTPVRSIPIVDGDGDLLLNYERAMYASVRLRWIAAVGTGGTIRAKLVIKLA